MSGIAADGNGPSSILRRPAAAGFRHSLLLVCVLVIFSLPDLLSPPISPTISRQTQTFAQTTHFVQSGFSPAGLAIDVDGPTPFHIAYEFPLYEGIVGVLFLAASPSFFWGKIVSLAATIVSLWLFVQLVSRRWGDDVGWWSGLFFATSPITLLLSAAFQPDALALAFSVASVAALARWRRSATMTGWLVFLAMALGAALAKFVVLVPLVPLMACGVLRRDRRWRTPSALELLTAVGLVLAPFLLWMAYRAGITDPRAFGDESRMFLVGDLTRFLHPAFYVKPAFTLGVMTMCGAGVALALVGLSSIDTVVGVLLLGVAFYYALIPTAAEQTYYAWPALPALAILMALGVRRLLGERPRHARVVALAIAAAWLAGFAVAAPYTLRHDRVTLAAARAGREISRPDDLLFVMNMHDRGTGVGGLNPSIVTLAGRRGWNVRFDTVDVDRLEAQIETRRKTGARWVVATWFTDDLDPWFTALLPSSFSRCPRLDGVAVNGRAITEALARRYPAVVQERNFAILRLERDVGTLR